MIPGSQAGDLPPRGEIHIRPMLEADVAEAERVCRLAFGADIGLQDSLPSMPEAAGSIFRVGSAAECAFIAESGGRIMGSIQARHWGTLGTLGPLTVHPECWNRGVGRQLMEYCMPVFESWGCTQVELFTHPQSVRNVRFYQRFGFCPRFLSGHFSHSLAPGAIDSPPYTLLSHTLPLLLPVRLAAIREITGLVYPGLDVTSEIVQGGALLGETLLLPSGGRLLGFALLQIEIEARTCQVKFGAVRTGLEAVRHFEELLRACAHHAAAGGCDRLLVGANAACQDVWTHLLTKGYRLEKQCLHMALATQEPFSQAYAIYDMQ